MDKKIFFISDTHFGHENIIRLSSRPFSSVEEMDETMIEKWNGRVTNADTVYIVGDLIYRNAKSPEFYLERLKGKKVLITGNHDASWMRMVDASKYFVEITNYKETMIANHPVTFCHYPMIEWKNSRKEGSNKLGYLVYGHTHNNVSEDCRQLYRKGNALNAGAEINGYAPVTFEELGKNNEHFKLEVIKDPVERAEYLCRKYHMHQCDKAGMPYYTHPFYVASRFEDEKCRIVALLHDTLEDTALEPELILTYYGKEMYDAVRAMTKPADMEYFEYVERLSRNPIARQVKMADLMHNMDTGRLKEVTEKDLKRVEKYKKAYEILKNS